MNYKHGLSDTRIYRIWKNMNDRCTNPNRHNYNLYGGKGIEVCDEWINDVNKFYEWSLENGYRDDLSIDRIDSDKNYEPSNCRWATIGGQAFNRKSTILIDYKGEVKSLTKWCETLNLPYQTIKKRYHRGMSFEKAISTPIKKYKKQKERC